MVNANLLNYNRYYTLGGLVWASKAWCAGPSDGGLEYLGTCCNLLNCNWYRSGLV